MKKAKNIRALLVIVLAAFVGGLSLWLIRPSGSREFDALKASALCVLRLPEGAPSTSATFTTRRPVEMFHIATRTTAGGEALALVISGDKGQVGSVSGVLASSFGLGRNVEPGTYTATLRQKPQGKGAEAVIASERPVSVTGWQIWSRTYVGLWALSGLAVLLLRRAANPRVRLRALAVFHALLLGLVSLFLYLLFHEGGHALAEMAFGRFDLARSDFWGIRGHPHSAGTAGPSLEPWQQTLISCAGPMSPTLAGFGLFVLWALPSGKKLRRLRPTASLYFSATVAGLIIGWTFCTPAYLLGLITEEGDIVAFVAKTGGPAWLAKGLLWGSFSLGAFILCQVVPEIAKAWKACFPRDDEY